ncbi:hypothetical protein KDA_40790 [Dictyobacter alpinus]|uniref:HTH tetR-type domain-containing protein n=1 Tax=Dictyobacter alpinus TaxID=2014873 RepID=A0A402BB68_9CHLR|nr:TetR/AcrR family transcriptional regulator [Dictyobacter alpinus]GCE28595.1 hypothetical protein KDA_40790 [Dictyobacter alpinus]
MARTVKPEEFAAKRGEILDAAQRLVFTKGYVQMSIQDILDHVRISSGAFHHYFDSRRTLLDAIIERIRQDAEKPLLPIIHDPDLSAIEKLQGVFDTLDHLRRANKVDVVRLLRVWYADDNAVVRQKVDEVIREQRVPLFNQIVRQGIQEDLFTLNYPDQAGEIILSLLVGMGNSHASLLLSLEPKRDNQPTIAMIVVTHAAYMDAIERVLGAPANSFMRINPEDVNIWVEAMLGEA